MQSPSIGYCQLHMCHQSVIHHRSSRIATQVGISGVFIGQERPECRVGPQYDAATSYSSTSIHRIALLLSRHHHPGRFGIPPQSRRASSLLLTQLPLSSSLAFAAASAPHILGSLCCAIRGRKPTSTEIPCGGGHLHTRTRCALVYLVAWREKARAFSLAAGAARPPGSGGSPAHQVKTSISLFFSPFFHAFLACPPFIW
jgi:hypothetical protein